MRKTLWFGTVLLGSMTLLGAGMLAAPGPAPIPVTTLISDTVPFGGPTLQLQSDQGGTYVNNALDVTSVITTAPGLTHRAGDFVMETGTGKKAPRRLFISFADPVAGSPANHFPAGLYAGFLKANCDLQGVDLRTLKSGAVVSCPLAIGFTGPDGQAYALHMNPGPTTDNDIVQFPETNFATITCTGSSNGTCTTFTIDPSGVNNGAPANVARLVLGQGNVPTSTIGDYYLSFEITVMR